MNGSTEGSDAADHHQGHVVGAHALARNVPHVDQEALHELGRRHSGLGELERLRLKPFVAVEVLADPGLGDAIRIDDQRVAGPELLLAARIGAVLGDRERDAGR